MRTQQSYMWPSTCGQSWDLACQDSPKADSMNKSAPSPAPLLHLLHLASLHGAPCPRLLLPTPVHPSPSLPVEFSERLTGTQLSWFLITLLSLHFSNSIKPLPGLNEAWTLQKSHLLSGRLGAGVRVGVQTRAAGQQTSRVGERQQTVTRQFVFPTVLKETPHCNTREEMKTDPRTGDSYADGGWSHWWWQIGWPSLNS